MRFTVRDQTWEVIETTRDGDIAVLVVDGRPTKRRGFFPHHQQETVELQISLSPSQQEDIPF